MDILFVNISSLEPAAQAKIHQVNFVLVVNTQTNQQIGSLKKKKHFYIFFITL